MSIGTTIKKLRRERDMTQEQLAEYLGITANAVSQWECDRTAPDISQLPVLANVFDVTTDYLLEVDISQKKVNIEAIREKAWALCNAGNKTEAAQTIREGLAKYPASFKMMYDLIVFLYQSAFHQKCTPEEHISFCMEAADYIDRIISGCNDIKIKGNAIELACSIFPAVGRYDDALRLTETISDTSKDDILTVLYDGDKLIDHVKTVICKSVSTAADQTIWLASSEKDDGSPMFDEDERITLYEKAITFYKTLYENGDFYFDAESLAEAEKRIANIWALRKDSDMTLYHLEECVKYVIMFDTYRKTGETYTSVIPFGRPPVGINWNYEQSKSGEILERLRDDEDYDFLRDDLRYVKLTESLRKTASRK